MLTSYSVDYYSFVVSSEIGKYQTSSFVFFFQIILAILGFLGIPYKFGMCFSISTKLTIGILIEIALKVL